MDQTVEAQLETIGAIIEIAVEFAVAYALQTIGALVILLIGLKFAGFVGLRTTRLYERKALDITLSRFVGNAVKILLVVIVVIITLSNFGIDIAPIVALGGAAALGLSFAVQGPVSNYGAGLVIILTLSFTVGNTILVKDVSVEVDEVSLSSTTLIGDPQASIHDFSYGGIILGLRYWVPSSRYFKTRFEVNRSAYASLKGEGIELMSSGRVAILAEPPAGN